ncbi:hypothetical protein F4818DRAFT_437862 [Hypoxylon cercidicola]|nr:hypothetical protein F4818DRAFT_437862 [Hypoxylon cercidicola]
MSKSTDPSKLASAPGPAEDKHVNFFPHLPPYSDPMTGLLSRLPRPWPPPPPPAAPFQTQLRRSSRSASCCAAPRRVLLKRHGGPSLRQPRPAHPATTPHPRRCVNDAGESVHAGAARRVVPVLSTTAAGLFGTYALHKRVTYYPQVVLGVAFAWAVFFAEAAVDGAGAG